MTNNIDVLIHSSIRINGDKSIVYIDPFKVDKDYCDGNYILITHEHYDHFSPEDIKKVANEDSILVLPTSMEKQAREMERLYKEVILISPGETKSLDGIIIDAIPAYNTNKKFHPKKSNWVGYIVTIDGRRVYIAGDTDATDEAKQVKCDIALVPVGGTYTMTHKEAAELVNIIKPSFAIPTHYGSIVGNNEDGELFKNNVNPEINVDVRL